MFYLHFISRPYIHVLRRREESKSRKRQRISPWENLFIQERKPSCQILPMSYAQNWIPCPHLDQSQIRSLGLGHACPDWDKETSTDLLNKSRFYQKERRGSGCWWESWCPPGIHSYGNPTRTIWEVLDLNLTSSLSQSRRQICEYSLNTGNAPNICLISPNTSLLKWLFESSVCMR